MATGILTGTRYSPENPPRPDDPDFARNLVEYLKREYGRISDALKGSNVFNFEEQFTELDKPQEGDVLYADGTSFDPGEGQGLYLFQNGAWRKLNADQATLLLKSSTNPTPTAEGEVWWDSDDNVFVIGDGAAARRSGKWEYISTANPSGVASVDFTDLSAFRWLHLYGRIVPATDSVNILYRTDTNNGASFDAGASDYDYAGHLGGEGAHATFANNGNTSITFNATAIGNTAAQEGMTIDVLMSDFNQAAYMQGIFLAITARDNNRPYYSLTVGRRLQATARDAFQLLFSSGNVASGNLILEGIRG